MKELLHQKRNQMMLNEPIGKLLTRMSVPAIIGMVVMALYNVVDSIFVGQGVGVLGLTGVSIVFPIQMFNMALAFAIGLGGASIVSRKMGAKDYESANATLGTMISVGFIISVFMFVTLNICLSPLLLKMGADSTSLPYAVDYLKTILYGLFFMIFSMSCNNLVRAEGNAKVAMFTMLVSAVLNIILDPIFIFSLNMGVKGAALATVIAQGFSALFLTWFFFSGKSILIIKPHYLIPRIKIIREILTIGIGAFARQAAGSVMMLILNATLVKHGGSIAVAAFGVIYRLLMFAIMPTFGVAQGFQPIAGFNYGAKNMHRVKEVLFLAIKANVTISLAFFILYLITSNWLIRIFNPDPGLNKIATTALRFILIAWPLVGLQVAGSTFFQAVGKAWEFFILAISRQILFLIPLVLIIPKFLGLTGIWLAFPLADIFATILTTVLLWWELSKIKKTL